MVWGKAHVDAEVMKETEERRAELELRRIELKQKRRQERLQRANQNIQKKYKERGLAPGDVFPLILEGGEQTWARVQMDDLLGVEQAYLVESDERGQVTKMDSSSGKNAPDEP